MDYSDEKSSLYFTSSIDQALHNNISWEILEALLDELTPTLTKSKELIKILLKQLQQFHKNFQDQTENKSREIIECKAHEKISEDLLVLDNEMVDMNCDQPFEDETESLKELIDISEESEENEMIGIVNQKNEALLGKSVANANVEKHSKAHPFDKDKIFEHIENSDEVQENDHEKSSNDKKELIDNEWYTFISNDEAADAEKENEVENVTIGTKIIHTGNMPDECKTCQERFTNKQQLKIHERIHTGEVPYHTERGVVTQIG